MSTLPDVTDAAEAIHLGVLSPVQLVERSLLAIETHNPTLNAFGDVYAESALQQAFELKSAPVADDDAH